MESAVRKHTRSSTDERLVKRGLKSSGLLSERRVL
jgi:hypothetical protein